MEPVYRLPPYEVEPVAASSLAETFDWSLSLYGVSELWKQTEGDGIKVAVLDTGCDLQHPDLLGAIGDAADLTGRSLFGANDQQGHGTWCCGLIGARANDVGVRGILPRCELLVGKVLGDDGSGSETSILRGIEWAAARGAQIISMSLGGPSPMPRVQAAIRAFTAQPQRFVICAAGNDGLPDSVNFPAVYDETIAVGAVDAEGNLTRFSSRGREVDIVAPGADMLSTVPRRAGGYAKMSGTSMATPFVAGIVGLMLAKHRKQGGQTGLETVGDLYDHLLRTAKDAGPVGRDDGYGMGLIDPGKLLDALDAQKQPGKPHEPEIVLQHVDGMGRRWHSKRIEWELVS